MHGRWVFALALGTTAWLSHAPALAQMTRDQCVDSNTRAQHLRADKKLVEARREFRKCSDPSCPALVRNDCTKRLDDVESAQPTIAFEAKDASGADLTAVKVEMDGAPLAETLDGTALPVDPGQHVFTFKAANLQPVTRTLVLTEGEKGRRERVVFGGPGVPTPAPLSATQPDTGPAMRESGTADHAGGGMGTSKVLGLVAAGLGVAGIAVGGVFGVQAIGAKNQQVSDCGSPTSCNAAGHSQALDDHSSAVNDGTISEIGFIAGGALLVGGVVLFLVGRSSSSPAPATGLLIAPSVAPGMGGMLVRGDF